MQFKHYKPVLFEKVIALFEASFGDAEGLEEGRTIATLVDTLLTTTANDELYGYCAIGRGEVLAAVFFSRFIVADETVTFMLSPMAVSTRHQKQGIGQGLIRFGLEQLRSQGVALVVTYGDPAFYSRFGFEPVSQQQIEAPYTLSHPEGWQAASLTAGPIPSIPGGTQCVPAFQNPVYW